MDVCRHINMKARKLTLNSYCGRHLLFLMLIYRRDTVIVVVAEWLRRLTRNQMGYTRTGSNPVHDDNFSGFVNNTKRI